MFKRLVKINVAVIVLANFSNLANYLIQLLTARGMTVEDYAVFNAVLGLGTILGSFSQVIPSVATKFVVKYCHVPGALNKLVREMYSLLLVLAGGVCALFLCAAGPIASFLNINSVLPVILFILGAFSYSWLAMLLGFLTGLSRYVLVSRQAFLYSLARLGAVAALIALGYAYNAILGAFVLCNLVIGYAAHKKFRAVRTDQPGTYDFSKAELREIVKFIAPVALMWLGINIMTNVDIVLAKHFCSAQEAGYYAAAALIARIAFFLPTTLNSVLYTEVAKNRQGDALGILGLMVFFTVMLSGAVWVSVYGFPALVIQLLFGARYLAAASFIGMLTGAMVILALCNTLFNFHLARSEYRFLYALHAGMIFTLGLIYLKFSHNAGEIALAIFLGSVTILALTILSALPLYGKALQRCWCFARQKLT